MKKPAMRPKREVARARALAAFFMDERGKTLSEIAQALGYRDESGALKAVVRGRADPIWSDALIAAVRNTGVAPAPALPPVADAERERDEVMRRVLDDVRRSDLELLQSVTGTAPQPVALSAVGYELPPRREGKRRR